MKNNKIAYILRRLRGDMTYQEYADECGISYSTLYRLINGYCPSSTRRKKLIEALLAGSPTNYFTYDELDAALAGKHVFGNPKYLEAKYSNSDYPDINYYKSLAQRAIFALSKEVFNRYLKDGMDEQKADKESDEDVCEMLDISRSEYGDIIEGDIFDYNYEKGEE